MYKRVCMMITTMVQFIADALPIKHKPIFLIFLITTTIIIMMISMMTYTTVQFIEDAPRPKTSGGTFAKQRGRKSD